MIPSAWYLVLGSVLFSIGVCGVLIRRNAIIVLMCIELMLNSVNLILAAYCAQVFVFFIMMVAAAEAAVGLAIFTVIYKRTGSTDVAGLTELNG